MEQNILDKKLDKSITNEMENSFLDYSMSVIVSRALPDVRDGLKPVHRRILYGMNTLGMYANTQFKKSARIVGDVMGKYHPHGDTSIYDAMVRMAQKFSYRYTLVDGHGNFGSIDGDGAAAQRYTEARMSKLSMEMLRDINKDTVNFIDNYDGSEKEPEVLPSRFPNILVNGTTGIAVGMATNIPPHNLGETIDATIDLIDNPDITIDELLNHIKGPDFPTAGIILGNSGIKKAYETGRGIIYIRAKAEIVVNSSGKQSIIITEIPYQINKANLVSKIASLVREKVIDGITDLRDESNIEGIKIVIELRKDVNANVILNNLYKQTYLQTSFGINLLALVHGEPRVLSLKEILLNYLDHQKEIIVRRTKFDLDKATKRAHVLDGLKIALDNIDQIIKLLKASKTDEIAKKGLIDNFNLTEMQADAILEMKLRRLTGLEREKIEQELTELLKTIEYLNELLKSDDKINEVIKAELNEIKEKYNDERKTKIDLTAIEYIEDESLIPIEKIMIILTNKGYIKRMPIDVYKIQNKGGVGIKGMTTNDEDFVEHMIALQTHDYVLMFTNKGKVYRMKGYKIPEYGRQAKGLPIVNLIPIEKDEYVKTIISLNEKDNYTNLIFITKNGLTKRTKIDEFDSIRENGKIAINLKEQDELMTVKKTNGKNHIVIASNNGRMVRFEEEEIRVMGRTASGVKGMEMTGSHCIDAGVASEDQEVLVITENGYGKRTNINEYRATHRGSKGVKALNTTKKTGNIVAFRLVNDEEDLIIITNNGTIIRMPIDQISKMSRVTQGVRLIKLKEDQKVTAAVNVLSEEEV
ncbi:MAG: DNA gyrase subunit A [Bacilli bacterium]|nr:DNA gyrase subunit A [Bacilli bacterium]